MNDHPKVQKLLALSLLRLGSPEEARELTEASLAARPEMADQHFNLALIHAQLEDYDAALMEAKKAVELQRTLWAGWRLIGEIEVERGNHRQAADAFLKALAVEPAVPRAREGLIASLYALGLEVEYALGLEVEANRYKVLLNRSNGSAD